jgi:DNA polymerase-3 subunit beta
MGFDVSAPQATLEQLLRAAGRAVNGRATHPVLQGLLLTAGEDRLTVAGYDLATGIRSEGPALVAETGSVVAPYRMLSALVAALPEGSMVRLKGDGTGGLAIEAGEGRYSVALSHEPDDFPNLPTLGDAEPFGLPFGALKRALNAVAFAVSTEESKQILCGVQFAINGGDLRVSGIDGKRGSIYDLPGIVETGKDESFVVPGPAVKELLKLGLADDDLLLISHTPALAAFEAGDTTILTNLLAGQYPDFAALLPKTCTTEIIGDRQAMISAVERAAIVANAETGAVAFTYDAKTGDISISVANDAGSAADLVAAENGSKGKDFTLTLASRYALDALRHVETELVSLSFADPRMVQVKPLRSELHRQLIAGIQVRPKEQSTGSQT